jgi:hypothetical protein
MHLSEHLTQRRRHLSSLAQDICLTQDDGTRLAKDVASLEKSIFGVFDVLAKDKPVFLLMWGATAALAPRAAARRRKKDCISEGG